MSKKHESRGQLRVEPKSESSRQIVDAVLEAAEQLLLSGDPKSITTNAIAERAGVSIGSLYRYFHDLQSILAEMFRRRERQVLAVATEALSEPTVPEVVRSVVNLLTTETHHGALKVRRALQMVPPEFVQNVSLEVDSMMTKLVAERAAELGLEHENLPMASFIVVRAVEAVVEAAVREHPEWIEDETFREALCALVLRFFAVESGAPSA